MRVLVIDTNTVIARRLRGKLEGHLQDVEVDTARNPMLVRAKLKQNVYDLIVADIESMLDPAGVAEMLTAATAMVILWTTPDRMKVSQSEWGEKVAVIAKPSSDKDFTVAAKLIQARAAG